MVDTDKDGVINAEELEQVAKRLHLNISRSQAEKMIMNFGKKGEVIFVDRFQFRFTRLMCQRWLQIKATLKCDLFM
jgi:Ca2+-binding EF-hand superfamily protein